MNAFDRNLACGPWRLLPVPAHLADARLADGPPYLFSGAMAGLAGLGLPGLRYWLILSRVEMKLADLVVPAVALIALVASAVVHAVAARAHARRREREEIAQGVAGAAS